MNPEKHQPWHGLPLYFADHPNPQKAARGLAVLEVLDDGAADNATQKYLWRAYFKLRGQGDATPPATDFMPREEWLVAAADVARALPGGAVLAHTLKKLATPEKLPGKTLEAYAPALARGNLGTEQTLPLAAKAIALWQQAWQGAVGKAEPAAPLQKLIWHLRWLEPFDIPHLPPEKLRALKGVHLALVLSQNMPALARHEGLEQAVANLMPALAPFQGTRFDGLGAARQRQGFYHPHGYGNPPRGLYKTLMAENVWLRSLPVYWQGSLLTPEEQALLAKARHESGLATTLEAALSLSAYRDAPSARGWQEGGVNRKAILDAIIQDSTKEF